MAYSQSGRPEIARKENAMDLSNVKSSLFGYNKLAVSSYVSNLDNEYHQKLQDLQKESKDAQEALRGQIDALRVKYEEEVQRLNERIDSLTKERDLLRRDNDTIADTLLDAKEYAEELRSKADRKAKERDDEHVQILEDQKSKVSLIDTKLQDVLGKISEFLAVASEHLNEDAKVLAETQQDIEEEESKYVPAEMLSGGAESSQADAEEASDAASESAEEGLEGVSENAEDALGTAALNAEAALEGASESTAQALEGEAEGIQEILNQGAEEGAEAAAASAEDTAQAASGLMAEASETSDEAIEKAASRAQELEGEAKEASESAIDQWKRVFGDRMSSEDAVSKFTQAAGEIAEKASVRPE